MAEALAAAQAYGASSSRRRAAAAARRCAGDASTLGTRRRRSPRASCKSTRGRTVTRSSRRLWLRSSAQVERRASCSRHRRRRTPPRRAVARTARPLEQPALPAGRGAATAAAAAPRLHTFELRGLVCPPTAAECRRRRRRRVGAGRLRRRRVRRRRRRRRRRRQRARRPRAQRSRGPPSVATRGRCGRDEELPSLAE